MSYIWLSGILLKRLNLLNNIYLHEMRDKIRIIYTEVFTCKKQNTLVQIVIQTVQQADLSHLKCSIQKKSLLFM